MVVVRINEAKCLKALGTVPGILREINKWKLLLLLMFVVIVAKTRTWIIAGSTTVS
jgi:hypothetical protein